MVEFREDLTAGAPHLAGVSVWALILISSISLQSWTIWLHNECACYMRWSIIAGMVAVGVTAVAVFAHSIFFAVVAGYLYLLSCNRWMEYRRLRVWLTWAVPKNESSISRCIRQFNWDMSHPPKPLKITYWVAGVTAAAGVLAVSILIILTGAVWMRILYVVVYGVVALVLFKWVVERRSFSREMKFRGAVERAIWRDVT